MENASKALIIAAAILISILLISLGLIAYNSSKNTSSKAEDVSVQMQQGAQAGVDSVTEQISGLVF